MIPQWNYKYCDLRDQEKSKRQNKQLKAVFQYPGYEGYKSSSRKTYQSQDLAQLLPWDQQQQLVINARLRFDQKNCLFAELDDQAIKAFCQNYFNDSGEQFFSRSEVEANLMTENIYEITPLRDRQMQELYQFTWDNHLIIEKQVYGIDVEASKYAGYSKYGLVWETTKFEEIQAAPQAWLALSPLEMMQYCQDYQISNEQGCRVELAIYSKEEMPDWCYDYGFGIFKE